jgi:spermidine synthase
MNQDSKVIFSTSSDYNGNLQVIDRKYGRELVSDKGVFLSLSVNHKYLPYVLFGILSTEVFKKRDRIKKALIIGLAGGTIPILLFKRYPGIEIVSVEIDPVMNDIFKYFFSGDRYENHRIINVDANYLLKNPKKFEIYEEEFDFILLDTFLSISVTEFENYENFFKNVKKLLRKDGVLGVNMIAETNELYQRAQKNIDTISEIFKDVEVSLVCKMIGNANLVVLASDKLDL